MAEISLMDEIILPYFLIFFISYFGIQIIQRVLHRLRSYPDPQQKKDWLNNGIHHRRDRILRMVWFRLFLRYAARHARRGANPARRDRSLFRNDSRSQ